MTTRPPRRRTYLRLGRVSNLPTVWTNTVAGIALAGATVSLRAVVILGTAFSLLYVAGMFLNDAFDRGIDSRERPERPIPAGQVSTGEVFAVGFAFLGAGVALVGLERCACGGNGGARAVASAAALSTVIVLYDVWHKGNPLGPVLMALCRVLVYVTAALAVAGHLGGPVILGSSLLLVYLVGLTYVAKQRGVRPRIVARLIAGISLLDALLVASRGAIVAAALCALGFAATLFLQRYVRGT